MLTDSQIERYSRQIILPEVGGAGQQRLLAARVRIMAEAGHLSPALDYLAGAGVGHIRVDCPDESAVGGATAAIAELNPQVRIEPAARAANDEVALVLAGSDRIIEAARRLNHAAECPRVIFARLGEPYLIAVLESRPPCLACAAPELLARVEPGDCAGLTAMAATAELIKHLLRTDERASRLLRFTGYESRAVDLAAAPACTVCNSAIRARGLHRR